MVYLNIFVDIIGVKVSGIVFSIYMLCECSELVLLVVEIVVVVELINVVGLVVIFVGNGCCGFID